MRNFYTFSLRRWKRWAIVFIIVCFIALFLWLQRSLIFPFFYTDEPTAVLKGHDAEPHVALTFNISWGDEKVHDILKQLKEENVQATFFVSGEWAERHPEIIEDIQEGTHEFGMLGYRYKSYLKQDIDSVQRDLFQAKHVFDKLGFDDMKWLRPPSGHFNEEIEALVERLELKLIHWTVHPNDWKNPGTDVIVQEVMKDLEKGDIILLHASDAAKQTADALKELIPLIKDNGLSFVTISELMSQVGTDVKLVE